MQKFFALHFLNNLLEVKQAPEWFDTFKIGIGKSIKHAWMNANIMCQDVWVFMCML